MSASGNGSRGWETKASVAATAAAAAAVQTAQEPDSGDRSAIDTFLAGICTA
jgi:ABC-type branched-subunit amino acid transport system substrate-binding protein